MALNYVEMHAKIIHGEDGNIYVREGSYFFTENGERMYFRNGFTISEVDGKKYYFDEEFKKHGKGYDAAYDFDEKGHANVLDVKGKKEEYYFIDNENFERCSEVYKDLDKLGNGRYTTTQVGRWGRREGQDVVCEINDELRYVGSGVSELVFVDPKLVTKIAVEEFADDAFVNSLKKNLREVAHHMAVCFTDSATAEDAEKKFAEARIMMSRIKNYINEMVDVAKTRAAQAAKEKEERERLEKEKQEQEAERKKIDVAAQQFEEEIDRLFGDDEKDEIYDEDSPVV